MGNSSSGSILPWDDWFYHVDDLKAEVSKLHDQAVSAQDSIRAQVPQYNSIANQTKQLMAANAALVIIARAVKFDDLQLKDFEAQLEALPDPPKGSIPAEFGAFLSEITGSFYILKAIANLGSLAKDALFTSTEVAGEAGGELAIEGLAETGTELGVEAAVEGTVEVGAEAALADTGIGIIAAVGLDAVFGAINGAQERDQLQEQINKLNDALNTLNKFQSDLTGKFDKLNGVIISEEGRFKGIATALQAIIPYMGAQNWQDLPSDRNAIGQYIAAQSQALKYYGLMSQLRITYLKAKERAPTASREAIISVVLMSAKADVTHEELEGLWDILAQYSEGMKDVQP